MRVGTDRLEWVLAGTNGYSHVRSGTDRYEFGADKYELVLTGTNWYSQVRSGTDEYEWVLTVTNGY